jgi:trace amine associated receptor
MVCPADFNKEKKFYTFVAVSAFFLPTVVILVMYAFIFIVVHKRQMMLRNGELGQTPNDQNQRTAFRQDLKVIRMLLVVVGVFILCWGPCFVWILLDDYHPTLIDWNSTSLNYRYGISITGTLVNALPYINSLCNPIIYACLDKKYREAFKNLFQRMMCRRNSRRRRPDAIELRALRTT